MERTLLRSLHNKLLGSSSRRESVNNIYIFINTVSIVIFGLSFLISFFVYRNLSNSIEKLEKAMSFSFFLSVLIGSSYFLYSLSHEMTLDNMGDYLTVLMHSFIYPSFCVLTLRVYKELGVKTA